MAGSRVVRPPATPLGLARSSAAILLSCHLPSTVLGLASHQPPQLPDPHLLRLPHPTSQHGTTPLAAAASFSHLGVVELLLRAGADIDVEDRVRRGDRHGCGRRCSCTTCTAGVCDHAAELCLVTGG